MRNQSWFMEIRHIVSRTFDLFKIFFPFTSTGLNMNYKLRSQKFTSVLLLLIKVKPMIKIKILLILKDCFIRLILLQITRYFLCFAIFGFEFLFFR